MSQCPGLSQTFFLLLSWGPACEHAACLSGTCHTCSWLSDAFGGLAFVLTPYSITGTPEESCLLLVYLSTLWLWELISPFSPLYRVLLKSSVSESSKAFRASGWDSTRKDSPCSFIRRSLPLLWIPNPRILDIPTTQAIPKNLTGKGM